MANNVEVNLGLDVGKGYQLIFTYVTKSFVFIPPHIAGKRTSRLENINCSQISKIPL